MKIRSSYKSSYVFNQIVVTQVFQNRIENDKKIFLKIPIFYPVNKLIPQKTEKGQINCTENRKGGIQKIYHLVLNFHTLDFLVDKIKE